MGLQEFYKGSSVRISKDNYGKSVTESLNDLTDILCLAKKKDLPLN